MQYVGSIYIFSERVSFGSSISYRYLLYGDVSAKAAYALKQPEAFLLISLQSYITVQSFHQTYNFIFWALHNMRMLFLQIENFFARLIQRVSPKSFPQAIGEVTVTQKFLENFSGDQVGW